VLRPKSVESLVNDLLPFAEYLTAQHPRLTSLRELDRARIEGSGLQPHPRLARTTRRSRSGAHYLDSGRPIGGAKPAQPA
jgi:hypothetical protein